MLSSIHPFFLAHFLPPGPVWRPHLAKFAHRTMGHNKEPFFEKRDTQFSQWGHFTKVKLGYRNRYNFIDRPRDSHDFIKYTLLEIHKF